MREMEEQRERELRRTKRKRKNECWKNNCISTFSNSALIEFDFKVHRKFFILGRKKKTRNSVFEKKSQKSRKRDNFFQILIELSDS